MKAYVLKGINQLKYEEVEKPVLTEGWVLLKVGAAGICESDIPRIYQTGTYHFPTIPGHEFAGTVVEVYDDEHRSWVGKRVGVFPLIPCKECYVCQEGKYEMCRNYDYLGSRRDGGFAEYVAVPVWNLIELPDEVPMEVAALLEPASVARHAVQRLQVTPEDTVVVYGLGTIGIMMTQWLHIMGVKKVYAIGHHVEHGDLMKQTASPEYEYMNADGNSLHEHNTAGIQDKHRNAELLNRNESDMAISWIMEHTNGQGASIVIDCVSSSETLSACLNCVRPGGQFLAVGNPKGDIELDKASYWKVLRNQIRMTGTWNSSFYHSKEDDWHQVIEACCNGTLKLSPLITHKLPFEHLEEGLLIAKERKEYRNKIVICRE